MKVLVTRCVLLFCLAAVDAASVSLADSTGECVSSWGFQSVLISFGLGAGCYIIHTALTDSISDIEHSRVTRGLGEGLQYSAIPM